MAYNRHLQTVSELSLNFRCKELLRDRSKTPGDEGLDCIVFSSDEIFSPDLFVIMNREPLSRRDFLPGFSVLGKH
jgi:hypothetical protein